MNKNLALTLLLCVSLPKRIEPCVSNPFRSSRNTIQAQGTESEIATIKSYYQPQPQAKYEEQQQQQTLSSDHKWSLPYYQMNAAEIPAVQTQPTGPPRASGLSVEINPSNSSDKTLRFITVKNQGDEDDYIRMSAYTAQGQVMLINPPEFHLAGGTSTEIPLTLISPSFVSQQSRSASALIDQQIHQGSSIVSSTANPLDGLVTINARGKRDSVKRSFFFEDDYNGGAFEPFCFEKDVSGTCRYRTSPEDCFRWEWTAYATILNRGIHKITSIPEGLYLTPGDHARARVYLKVSCCTPVVQFISQSFKTGANSCVVDVREHQNLHPGEIAGIVIAGVVLVLIILVVVFLCARKRRQERITVGMLPRAKSRDIIYRSQS